MDFSWRAMAAAIRVAVMVFRTAMAEDGCNCRKEDDLVGSLDLI